MRPHALRSLPGLAALATILLLTLSATAQAGPIGYDIAGVDSQEGDTYMIGVGTGASCSDQTGDGCHAIAVCLTELAEESCDAYADCNGSTEHCSATSIGDGAAMAECNGADAEISDETRTAHGENGGACTAMSAAGDARASCRGGTATFRTPDQPNGPEETESNGGDGGSCNAVSGSGNSFAECDGGNGSVYHDDVRDEKAVTTTTAHGGSGGGCTSLSGTGDATANCRGGDARPHRDADAPETRADVRGTGGEGGACQAISGLGAANSECRGGHSRGFIYYTYGDETVDSRGGAGGSCHSFTLLGDAHSACQGGTGFTYLIQTPYGDSSMDNYAEGGQAGDCRATSVAGNANAVCHGGTGQANGAQGSGRGGHGGSCTSSSVLGSATAGCPGGGWDSHEGHPGTHGDQGTCTSTSVLPDP